MLGCSIVTHFSTFDQLSHVEVLMGLCSELTVFGGTFPKGTSSMAAPPPVIVQSPSQKTKDIQHAQEFESDFDNEKLEC